MTQPDPNDEHADALSEGFEDAQHRRRYWQELREEAEQDRGERDYERELDEQFPKNHK